MAVVDDSEQQPLLNNSSGSNLIEMNDDNETLDSAGAGVSVSDLLWKHAPAPAKDAWKEHSPTIMPVVGKVKTFFAENGKVVQMVYGGFCVFYGGSWPTLALILAFLSVYDTSAVVKECKTLFSGSSTERLTPDKAAETLASVGKFLTIVYCVWTSKFIASICMAMAIEPYLTTSLESSKLFNALHQAVGEIRAPGLPRLTQKQWFKFVFVQVNRIVLSILGHFVFSGTFATIFMGLYGMTLACSTAGQPVQDALNKAKGFGDVSTKSVILWVVVLVGTLWQALTGFNNASFLRYLVPLGFLVTYKGSVSASFWKVHSSKDQ